MLISLFAISGFTLQLLLPQLKFDSRLPPFLFIAGALYGTYEAFRYKVPGFYKVRYIGQTTLSSAAVRISVNAMLFKSVDLPILFLPGHYCELPFFSVFLCRSLACSLELVV